MADNESIVKIKTEGDTSGAEKVEKAIDKTGDAAEKAAEKTKKAAEEVEKAIEKTGDAAEKATEKIEEAAEKAGDAAENASEKAKLASENAANVSARSANRAAGAWDTLAGAVSRCKSAIGTFMGALGVVGFAISGVKLLCEAYEKLKGWLDSDKEAAEELARKIQDENIKAAIESSTKAYERLREKLSEVLRLEQERDRLADRRLSQERAIEDAQTELEMQRELAGLDHNDPDYAQNAELVRSRYARVRADRAAQRAEQDNRIAQARRYEQADKKEKDAKKIEDVVYGEAGDAVIALKGQIHNEKDPEKRKAKEAELEKLVAEQQKRLAEAKKLRDEAASLRKEAETELGSYTVAKISAQAVNVAQDAADADTRRQIEQNRQARAEAQRREDERRAAEEAKAQKIAAQRAADQKTVKEGGAEIDRLQADADLARHRVKNAADAYDQESAEAYEAQNRYDMLVANGGSRKDRSAALAALQKEQREAEVAKHEMERVAAEVANTLQGINEQIKALSSAVKKAEGRLAQNQADAPEG